MTDLLLIIIGTVLVNNLVLTRFLGLCPLMGASTSIEAAFGMSMATTFVLTLASALAWLVHHWVLVPLNLEYLRLLCFILVIAELCSLPKFTSVALSHYCTRCWASTCR